MAEQDEQTGSGLRAQLEALLEEKKAWQAEKQELQGAQRELAFSRAGIDLDSGPGKLLAKAYDGELEAEAIRTFAEEYGIAGTAAQSADQAGTQQTQQRMDALRSASQPDGTGKRMSNKEWLELSKTDPEAAKEAHQNGMVDFSPEVVANMAANRSAVRLG